MSDTPKVGTHTLILAREGPADITQDVALLRGAESVFGLARGTLPRSQALAHPEFRLAEGLSREMAERLVEVAVRSGFVPRVRQQLGIKWSSERGGMGFVYMILAISLLSVALFPILNGTGMNKLLSDVFGADHAASTAMFVSLGLYLTAIWAALRWQMSRLYLPLAIPTLAWAQGDASPVREDPLSASVADARLAVDELRAALRGSNLPINAVADIVRSAEDLDALISALARVDTDPTASASGLAALRKRLDSLGADDTVRTERERLEAAIRSELAARDAAEARFTETIRELVSVRRAALEARAALRQYAPTNAITRLERSVAAVGGDKRAETAEEAERRRVALQRARQAQHG